MTLSRSALAHGSSPLALVVAAGSGQRFGAALPKQYQPLGKRSVLGETLARLEAAAGPQRIALVIHPDYRTEAEAALAALAPDLRARCLITAGGASRQDSVRLGLEALAPQAQPGALVMIHDAARPLLSAEVAARLLAAAAATGASLPLLPVADTLKRLNPDGAEVATTQDRAGLMRAQTPQVFDFAAILHAHRQLAGRDDLTDDASLFEVLGLPVAAIAGDERLLKITSQGDLALVRALIQLEAQEPLSRSNPTF